MRETLIHIMYWQPSAVSTFANLINSQFISSCFSSICIAISLDTQISCSLFGLSSSPSLHRSIEMIPLSHDQLILVQPLVFAWRSQKLVPAENDGRARTNTKRIYISLIFARGAGDLKIIIIFANTVRSDLSDLDYIKSYRQTKRTVSIDKIY